MSGKKRNLCEIGWYAAIFVFCYVWFMKIHPLVVFDADDWTYIAYVREGYPVLGAWNPARVFPEVFMPLVSTVSVHLLMPLTGDYIEAITMGSALVVAAFITVYVRCFGEMMKRLFRLSALEAGYADALFLVLHFLLFRGREFGNQYLFYCVNLTCYYYYLIPALLSCCLVMTMVANPGFEKFREEGSMAKKGIFWLLVYLAIFSNLPGSGILAVYAGAMALLDLLRNLKKLRILEFLKRNSLYLLILAAWLVSAVFELSGDRAGSALGASKSLIEGLLDTAYIFRETLYYCNRMFLGLCVILFALAAVLLVLSKGKEEEDKVCLNQLAGWILCAAVMLVYTMILSAKVEISYMSRSEYLYGVFFFGLLIVMVCFGYLAKKQPGILAAVPIALCVLVFEINTMGATFLESTMEYVDEGVCAQISRDLVEQVVAADEEGLSEITVFVPDWGSEDNWPHALQLMNRMPEALYEHGVIGSQVKVNFEISETVNEYYHLGNRG